MSAAQPIEWPQVVRRPAPAAASAPPAAPAAPPWLDPEALGALLALPLGTLAGRRLGLSPADAAPAATAVLLARLEGQGMTLLLAADTALADGLMTLLFGGAGPSAPLSPLAPASASWGTLARLLAGAVASAIVALEGPALRVAIGNRPALVPLLPARWIAWRIEAGAPSPQLLHLGQLEPEPGPAAAPGGSPARWAGRVEALARDLELPVRLRIAEWRLPVARIAALRPGDVLAIQRPRELAVIVDGTAIATFPAGVPRDPATGDRE